MHKYKHIRINDTLKIVHVLMYELLREGDNLYARGHALLV